jgi:hypothetical protein
MSLAFAVIALNNLNMFKLGGWSLLVSAVSSVLIYFFYRLINPKNRVRHFVNFILMGNFLIGLVTPLVLRGGVLLTMLLEWVS